MTTTASSPQTATSAADAPPADAALRLQRAASLIAMQRWDDAAAVLDLPEAPPQLAMTRRLARNMAAMLAVRPKVYQRLLECLLTGDTGPYRLFTSDRGNPGLLHLLGDGRATPLCAGRDPLEALDKLLRQHADQLKRDRVFAMLSLGDGYLLLHLAQNPPRLAHPQIKPLVGIAEPDPRLVLAVMRLHDLADDDGPIRQRRFRWYVGPDWAEQWEAELEADDYLPPPQYGITQSTGTSPLPNQLEIMVSGVMDRVARQREAVFADDAGRTADDHARMLGEAPPRPPRALLMTSRFTTVLQHATRDTARALEELGWETLTNIEPSDAHRCWNGGMVRQLQRFKPDLILSIDHLRREQAVIPPGIPFLCWVQDDLPWLMEPSAGASITRRDFMMLPAAETWTRDYGYPIRQCTYADKATRIPDRPATWTCDGEDLVYVSNASKPFEQVRTDVLEHAAPGTAQHAILDRTLDRMGDVYARGEALHVVNDLVVLLRDVQRELGETILGRVDLRRWGSLLFTMANNPLYRQQALRWVADAAEQRGLTLALYGEGWDRHPHFARYARGPVQYGRDLEELTRRSRINLQIVPFGCLHQRLLDGLVAGGFFLVREHPVDRMLTQLAALMPRIPEHLEHRDEVRAALDSSDRARFDSLLERWTHQVDLPADEMIPLCRRRERQGLHHTLVGLPHLDAVAFDGPASVAQQIAAFIDAPDRRSSVRAEQEAFVRQHLSYASVLRRVTRWMSDQLREEVAA